MKKTCRELVREVLTRAAEENRILTEESFFELLDGIEGFWEQAKDEGFIIEHPNRGLAK